MIVGRRAGSRVKKLCENARLLHNRSVVKNLLRSAQDEWIVVERGDERGAGIKCASHSGVGGSGRRLDDGSSALSAEIVITLER